MDLPRLVLVQRQLFAQLPHMGVPIGQKLVKSGSTWARLCGTHISETTGWIYTIWSSMELSRPVVVQYHGHLTLTLDFQGQILKMLYLRNGRADWHGTKGMWVNRMLHPLCDFQLWLQPWPCPWIFTVKFWKSHISGIWWSIDMESKGCESIECCTHVMTFNFPLTHDLNLGFFKVKFWKCCISGMGWPIDMEWKECESIGCYTHFVTFNFDLNHEFDLLISRSNFEKVLSQEWDGPLTWNQRDVSR